MDMDEIARNYGYGDDEDAIAILRVLDRVSPEYLRRYAIGCLTEKYENKPIWLGRISSKLLRFINDGLVERIESLTPDEMGESMERLVTSGKIDGDEYRVPSKPRRGFRLSIEGFHIRPPVEEAYIAGNTVPGTA